MTPSAFNSAMLSVSFDWSVDSRTGKVTSAQEAFKYSPIRLAQGGGDEFSYPYDVIDTKLKVRGTGKVARIRYESANGKDMRLLGYAMVGNTRNNSEASK